MLLLYCRLGGERQNKHRAQAPPLLEYPTFMMLENGRGKPHSAKSKTVQKNKEKIVEAKKSPKYSGKDFKGGGKPNLKQRGC